MVDQQQEESLSIKVSKAEEAKKLLEHPIVSEYLAMVETQWKEKQWNSKVPETDLELKMLKSAYEQKEAFMRLKEHLEWCVLDGQQAVEYLEKLRDGSFADL